MITYSRPEEHVLITRPDGSYACSCGEWHILYPVGGGKGELPVKTVKEWHRSHQNAVYINI